MIDLQSILSRNCFKFVHSSIIQRRLFKLSANKTQFIIVLFVFIKSISPKKIGDKNSMFQLRVDKRAVIISVNFKRSSERYNEISLHFLSQRRGLGQLYCNRDINAPSPSIPRVYRCTQVLESSVLGIVLNRYPCDTIVFIKT